MKVIVPGLGKRQHRGWFAVNKWLLLRRICQFGVLTLFLIGPLAGIWIVKGNLASSLTFETLPLTDPYLILQSLFAGHITGDRALIGAAIVLAFYLLVGGRVYCSWICPINIVSDTAEYIRRRFGLHQQSMRLNRNLRYWILALTIILALITGSIVWELVNPVSILYRGLLFGLGTAWVVVVAIFFFDLFISRQGWCGHLCPVGAFYSLVGHVSLLRVTASKREQCNDCMDCFSVCPEPQVIKIPLKGGKDTRQVILSGSCTNCARCIDVCDQDVFRFTTRFFNKPDMKILHQMEVAL